MPALPNLRHETFAQLRAKGARLDDAYEDAGFIPYKGHASRLAREKGVAELRLEAADAHANLSTVITSLMRIAKASEDKATLEGVREARITLLEACQLMQDNTQQRRWDRED